MGLRNYVLAFKLDKTGKIYAIETPYIFFQISSMAFSTPHWLLCSFIEDTYCHVFGSVTIDGVWIGLSDLLLHLYTPLGITSKYGAIGNLHTSQITIAPAKAFPACCVSNSRTLGTASNSGDSSAFRTHVVTVR
jgi:hypothetical protein